jgi:hypothetical protein
MLQDKELVTSIFPTLTNKGSNFDLIYRLLSFYQPSSINPHPVPEATLQALKTWGAQPEAQVGGMLVPFRK